MATIFKRNSLEFREDFDATDNYRLQSAVPRFSQVVGSKNLFFDLRKLNPDEFSFPYHFHRHAEEMMMVVSGSMTLRTNKGLEEVTKGDVIFFEMGENGAHQFYNHTNEPCTYLDVRTLIEVDICEYPDSGKLGIIPTIEVFEKNSQVEYFKGEREISPVWDEVRRKKN